MSTISCPICGKTTPPESSCCAVVAAARAIPLSPEFLDSSELRPGAQLIQRQVARIHGDAEARAMIRRALSACDSSGCGPGLLHLEEGEASRQLAARLWFRGLGAEHVEASGISPAPAGEPSPEPGPAEAQGEASKAEQKAKAKAAAAAPAPKPPPTERDLGDLKAFAESMAGAQDEGAAAISIDGPKNKK